jgi:hypothetical protein
LIGARSLIFIDPIAQGSSRKAPSELYRSEAAELILGSGLYLRDRRNPRMPRLAKEIDKDMALLGRRNIGEIGRDVVTEARS